MTRFESHGAPAGAGPALPSSCRPPSGSRAMDAACAGSHYGAVVLHIHANLTRRITVNELAHVAALSIFQLTRLLRREHGTTPYGLVLAIRVEHAMDRLRDGATIAETAFHAGFADQSHLTRHFKRLTGMTPKQYCVL